MGSLFSSASNGEGTSGGSDHHQILTFDSTAEWKIHFERSVESYKLMVIDFTASWCGPCRFMEPVLNEFASKYTNVEFIKIDVDQLDDVAQEFGVQECQHSCLSRMGKKLARLSGPKRMNSRGRLSVGADRIQ